MKRAGVSLVQLRARLGVFDGRLGISRRHLRLRAASLHESMHEKRLKRICICIYIEISQGALATRCGSAAHGDIVQSSLSPNRKLVDLGEKKLGRA